MNRTFYLAYCDRCGTVTEGEATHEYAERIAERHCCCGCDDVRKKHVRFTEQHERGVYLATLRTECVKPLGPEIPVDA